MKPIIEILDQCNVCGACVEICPLSCLKLNDNEIKVVNQESCFGCRKCEDVCPLDAICIRSIVP